MAHLDGLNSHRRSQKSQPPDSDSTSPGWPQQPLQVPTTSDSDLRISTTDSDLRILPQTTTKLTWMASTAIAGSVTPATNNDSTPPGWPQQPLQVSAIPATLLHLDGLYSHCRSQQSQQQTTTLLHLDGLYSHCRSQQSQQQTTTLLHLDGLYNHCRPQQSQRLYFTP